MASFSANEEPVGIVPPVNSTPMFVPIPEDKLKIDNLYLVEIHRTLLNGQNMIRKYKGVLDTLKDNNCYKFKYLENVNINIRETIRDMTFNGDDGDTFIKIYDASGDILTLDQIKTMEQNKTIKEIGHDPIVGNTYYVRYFGPDEITDSTFLNSFRGVYNGKQATPWAQPGVENDHSFSNIVKLNTKICLNDRTNITFYYTSNDLIQYDRQRRVFGKIVPYGEKIINDPSQTYGGNKRKTNKQKRKTNKRKSNKRKAIC